MMNRNASATWKGNLHGGEGTLTTESGVLSKTQYSHASEFAEGIGTNPDELIAASLSGCFSMALSREQLDGHASVPDATQALFMDAALAARTNCPIARVLNTNISMSATLDL